MRVLVLPFAFAVAFGGVSFVSDAQEALAPPATLQQITTLLERGDVSAAGRALDPALRAHPEDAVLQNLAGVVAAQQRDVARAEVHFQNAIRLAPARPAGYENLGRLYQEGSSGNPALRAKAIAIYRRLLEIDATHVEALFQSAFLLALEGEFAAAREFLGRLPEQFRERTQVLAIRAVALAELGDTAGARAAADALAAHPALSEADVLAALPALRGETSDGVAAAMLGALDRRALASPRSLRALAMVHVRAGRLPAARDVLERTIRAEGASASLLIDLGRVAARQKDYRGALGYLAHARSLEPANATVHFLFGMVCVEENLIREAYDSLKKAVELEPDNPLVNYAMGAVATHRHEPSESLPYFEKYVRLQPDDARGYFALGTARFYSNLFDEARAPLERATRAPQTATGAHLFLGRIARQVNDLATARREIERALQLNAGLADAWAELGWLQTRAGEFDGAADSLNKALSIQPDHHAATLNLAALYARTRDPRAAAQAAKVAALIDRREARAQEFLRIIEVVPYAQ